MPNFYANNPEFRGKVGKTDLSALEESKKESTKGGKRKKNSKKDEAASAKLEAQEKKDKVDDLMATGGEINVLDAQEIELDSQEIGKWTNQKHSKMASMMITSLSLPVWRFMTDKHPLRFCNTDEANHLFNLSTLLISTSI